MSGRASWASQIDALRKAGQLKEALDLARHAYQASPQSSSVKRSFGWALYALAKAHVDDYFEALKLGGAERQARKESALTRLDFMISEYAEARLHKPDLCLSLLLVQASRPQEPPKSLPRVLNWVGLEGLREEDTHASEGHNGQLYPSLLERLAERCATAALLSEKPKACALALSWIKAAHSRAAPLINPEALTAHVVSLTRLSGEIEGAVTLARERLKQSHHDALAWREWSLCVWAQAERAQETPEQVTLAGRALWLGGRAAHEASASLSAQERTLWAERLALWANVAQEPQLALALGLWALAQRARFGVPCDEDTLYLTRTLGGEATLHHSKEELLRLLDVRAMSESEALLKAEMSS